MEKLIDVQNKVITDIRGRINDAEKDLTEELDRLVERRMKQILKC